MVLLGVVFKVVATPGHTVRDLVEPDVKVLRVQHLVDMVEYKEHQLALHPHWSAVFVQGVGIMPILEQFQEVRPLVNTMDPHVGLVVLTAGGGPWEFRVCGDVWRVHQLHQYNQQHEPDPSGGGYQCSYGACYNLAGHGCAVVEYGHAPDFGVIHLPVQTTLKVPYEILWVFPQAFVWWFGKMLVGERSLDYRF